MKLDRDYGEKVVFFPGRTPDRIGRLGHYAQVLRCTPAREVYYRTVRKLYREFSPHQIPFPQYLHLEVTNACNMQCVMCPRENMDRPVGFMEWSLFEKIIDEAALRKKFVEGLALMGLGEPLLSRDLIRMSQRAKQAGFTHVYTSTNALLLDRGKAEEIIERSGLDRVIFSVDGATRETYERIRRGGDHATVVDNIEGFLDLKRSLGSSTPRTTLQILVMEDTREELEDFLDLWVPRMGEGDDILVKHVDTFGGQVEDRRIDREGEPAERFACRQLWKDLSISWDGRVTVCCKDVLYKLAVGNVREHALEELWRGKRWEAIRKVHLEGRWDSIHPCDGCNEWYL